MQTIEKIVSSSSVEITENLFGIKLWETQKAILDAIDDPEIEIVAVSSCHASGKTKSVGCSIMAYLLKNPGNSRSICTAPTRRQVEQQIFLELSSIYHKIQTMLPGSELLKAELRLAHGWGCIGFTTKDPERFQGYHGEKIILHVDEGSGVDSAIYMAIEGIRASGDIKLVITSNPTKSTGYFADLFRNPPPRTKLIKISCFDTPNFYGNNIKTIEDLRKADVENLPIPAPAALSLRFAQAKLKQWGFNSIWFKIKILGEFAQEDADSIFTIESIQQAFDSEITYTDKDPIMVSIDPARYGDDRFACLLQRGKVICDHLVIHKTDLMTATGRVVEWLRPYQSHKPKLFVDPIGIGSGVADRLKELGFDVVEVNVSVPSNTPDKYLNLRAENYFELQDLFNNEDIAIHLPKEISDDMMNDLLATKYQVVDSTGKVKVLSKTEIKKQTGGVSPDLADALMLLRGGSTLKYVQRGVIAI